uniref:FimV N-terminal domain-containing protein n=1 Tax=Candidatus Kentrum sp. TUN TaxID=2126343 RepID=A0A450ZJY1_9GAMM|nr:MAG: FimV N-terminal domain-containing protein [Candidatus Kentron sp. TUN]VFK54038.1 MAG: FimV N-terminal domain-containing protein [Candidatus Kentron sp. TUN]VFK60110.1 MAG: FimV N-terminal domain-containing protein [Candidatus Kentron sp. TUN]
MRKSIFALVLLLFVPTTSVYALTLMDITLSSKLNEPLDARIPLRVLQSTDMETIQVKLADTEHFTRANLERLPILSNLRFNGVQNPDGYAYIQITTDSVVNEPFLSFIVEVNWSRGRILREYTLLLDPPMYTGAISTTVREAEATVDEVETAEKVTKPSTIKALPITSTAIVDGKFDDANAFSWYGPVTTKDTLWSIATRFRPNKSISIEQMMLMLQQHNPKAFSQNNINTLKAGAILRIPNPGKTTTIPQDEALEKVRQQHIAWEEFRQRLAASPTAAPEGSPVPSTEAKVSSTESKQSGRVEILSAGTAVEGVGQVGKKGNVKELRAEIALVKEEVDAKSRENEELRSRLVEAEDLIQEFVHLMEIQSDEINALKKKLMETRSEAELAASRLTESKIEVPTTSQTIHEEGARIFGEEMKEPIPETEKMEGIAAEQETSATSTLVPTSEVMTPVEETESRSASQSEKNRLIDHIHDNLIIIVAGLGGILVFIGGVVLWLRRRREIAEEKSSSATEIAKESMAFQNTKMGVKETLGSDKPRSGSTDETKGLSQKTPLERKKKPVKLEEEPQLPKTAVFPSAEKNISFASDLSPDIPESNTTSNTRFDTVEEITEDNNKKPIVIADESNAKIPPSNEWSLDLAGSDLSEISPSKTMETKATEGENLDLNFGFDLDPESPRQPPTQENNKTQPSDFPSIDMSDSSIDETQTKLDLAQAYIDMGDTEGARNILDKILKEGNKVHKNIAKKLLEKFD